MNGLYSLKHVARTMNQGGPVHGINSLKHVARTMNEGGSVEFKDPLQRDFFTRNLTSVAKHLPELAKKIPGPVGRGAAILEGLGQIPLFDDRASKISFSDPDEMGFRSVAEDVLGLPSFPNKGTAKQMEAALGQGKSKSLPKPVMAQIGNRKIDKEELKFLGITSLLNEAKRTGQPVTKQNIIDAVNTNKPRMALEQEVLIEQAIPDTEYGSYFDDVVEDFLEFDVAEGNDYIQERVEEELTDNDYYAKQLAEEPEAEDEIRSNIYRMLEDMYNESPMKRLTLIDQGNVTDIYAIGNDDQGWWNIRKGGLRMDQSETLTQDNTFDGLLPPLEMSTENEARVQLRLLAQDHGIAGEGAQWRDNVVEDYPMGDIGEVTNYREIKVLLPEEAGGNIGSHYGDDVAYHMRVSDRDYVNKEKALYVDEIQSDYAQAGAWRKGFQTDLNDYSELFETISQPEYGISKEQIKLATTQFKSPEANAARREIIDVLDKELAISSSPTSDGRHIKNVFRADRISGLQHELRLLLNPLKGGLKEQPLVVGQGRWVQHAVKNLITEMVKTGKDRVIFTSGKNQAAHWGEKGLEQFYDVKLKNEVREVLKGIDKDAFEMVDAPSGRGGETMQHISIKNTQKIRDFLEGVGDKPKGFGYSGGGGINSLKHVARRM